MIHYTCLLTDDGLKGHLEETCLRNEKIVYLVKKKTFVGQNIETLITYDKKISFSLFKYSDFTVKTCCFSSEKKSKWKSFSNFPTKKIRPSVVNHF